MSKKPRARRSTQHPVGRSKQRPYSPEPGSEHAALGGQGRERLDVALVERGLAASREQARARILAGDVLVDGQVAAKPGVVVVDAAALEVRAAPAFVSRGGDKLAHALARFGVTVADRVALDAGASTGGFTDCLLQCGARRVYAVDVGYGQLDWRLRQDARVVVMERTNLRQLTALPEPVDLATLDLSFISLRLVLASVGRLLRPGGEIVALVKPQFEAGRGQVGRGGVVRDPAVHRAVLDAVLGWAAGHGYGVRGLTASPLRGPAGNVEFLTHLTRQDSEATPTPDEAAPAYHALIEAALAEVPTPVDSPNAQPPVEGRSSTPDSPPADGEGAGEGG
jgi:23S rRNA (cytidine1920-2'-O)/16S rRNA (cytidine1409-2'-O)-methyltransferase